MKVRARATSRNREERGGKRFMHHFLEGLTSQSRSGRSREQEKTEADHKPKQKNDGIVYRKNNEGLSEAKRRAINGNREKPREKNGW